MKQLGSFVFATFAALLAAAPVCAEEEYWGADTIRQLVRDYMSQSGKPVGDTVAIGPLDERMKVPACGAKPVVAPRSAYSSSLVVHCDAPHAWSYNLRVDIDGDGSRSTAPLSAGGPVQQWHVVVPRASLPVGTILSASMLEERDTNIAPGGSFIKNMDEAVGLRLKAPISPGIPLTTRNVVRAPAIMKGETVTLTAEGEGFSIATPGRAEDDGYEGDLLAVRNVKSGMVLMGRLAAGGVVLVR